jgi:predicted aspartyl protease
MEIQYRDGLLFTAVHLNFRGRKKYIDNIVIDTGAEQTLISQECVDDIGLIYENNDMLVAAKGIGGTEYSFVKKVDSIEIGEFKIENINIDFTGYIEHDINGLLGLDLLMKIGIKIDLKSLVFEK